MPRTALDRLRDAYHDNLSRDIIARRRNRNGTPMARNGHPVFNFADGGKSGTLPASVLLAEEVVKRLDRGVRKVPPPEQTAGTLFTAHTCAFLTGALSHLGHLLPGKLLIETRPSLAVIARFDQYEHLDELDRIVGNNPEIAAVLGRDYVITPDIVIGRQPLDDATINVSTPFVGDSPRARHSPSRSANTRRPILKASVSCKWTMRSDRAQNIRTEAHNLIRNRKGPTPHIVAVTMEPLPARLESVALGLGDLDCVYHAALDELISASRAIDSEHARQLDRLTDARRLRDISDLPLDLVS